MNTCETKVRSICIIVTLFINLGWLSVPARVEGQNNAQPDPQQAAGDLRAQKMRILDEIEEKNGDDVITELEPYLQDPDQFVHSLAIVRISRAGSKSTNHLIREKSLDTLFKCVLQKPEMELAVFREILECPFRSTDFSANTKDILHKELASSSKTYLILLLGAADMKSELSKLKELVDEVDEPLQIVGGRGIKDSHPIAFAALMARARMGEKEDIQRCIDLVESYPDEGFRVGVLWERLSYIRQPEVVEYLMKYFFMDKIEPGPETQKRMTYAQRAMIALSEMLVDFPKGKPSDFESYQQYIEYNRQWLSEQTEYDIIR